MNNPFQIMTDKEMEEADNLALRHRVRELSTAISQLADIASIMRDSYTVLRGTHVTIHEISRDLKILLARTKPKEKRRKSHLPLDETPLDEVQLSIRPFHCLRYGDYACKTVGDVRKYTGPELLRIPNFGRLSLIEVEKVIGRLGSNKPEPVPGPGKNDQ